MDGGSGRLLVVISSRRHPERGLSARVEGPALHPAGVIAMRKEKQVPPLATLGRDDATGETQGSSPTALERKVLPLRRAVLALLIGQLRKEKTLEARAGIEPAHKGFADLSLTTWVPRLGLPASPDADRSTPRSSRPKYSGKIRNGAGDET